MDLRTVLIATADAGLTVPLKAEFEAQGYMVRFQDHLEQFPEKMAAQPPQMLILDLDLSEQPPWDILALMRVNPETARIPFLIVSARHAAPRHVISGLRLGAVEYLIKPCDPRVLVARVGALLNALERRKKTAPESVLKTSDGQLSIDLKAHRCVIQTGSQSKELSLTPKEFIIMGSLLGKINALVTKEELLRLLWPTNERMTEENSLTLAQHIAHLRKKLGPLKARLKTLWGLGYRFE